MEKPYFSMLRVTVAIGILNSPVRCTRKCLKRKISCISERVHFESQSYFRENRQGLL